MSARASTRLVLASQSPRRRELLSLLGIPFEVVPSSAEELPLAGEAPVDFAVRVAREKATEVGSRAPDAVVLAADTIVSLDGAIFGKPRDRAEAIGMLGRLSGRAHSVYTAVSVVRSATGERAEGVAQTKVWFRELDRAAIEDYLQRENVGDKAGAYAIQGFAAVFIPKIDGDYTNVIGLPLPLVYDLLRRYGLI